MKCLICYENKTNTDSSFCERCINLKKQANTNIYQQINPELCTNCEWFHITCAYRASWSKIRSGVKNMCNMYVKAVNPDKDFLDRAKMLDKDGNERK